MTSRITTNVFFNCNSCCFQKLGYAELQLEYYKREYTKAKEKWTTMSVEERQQLKNKDSNRKDGEQESWLLSVFRNDGGSGGGGGGGGGRGMVAGGRVRSGFHRAPPPTTTNDSKNKKTKNKGEWSELSKEQRNSIFHGVHYDKNQNKYGILPKEYILEQCSLILGQVMLTMITSDGRNHHHNNNDDDDHHRTNHTHHTHHRDGQDKSREEIWLTSVCCHYSNGVNGDQYVVQ
jgi:hypothetical protein